MNSVSELMAQLSSGGRGEARLPVAELKALASSLREARARASTQLTVAAVVTLVLALAGFKLQGWRVGQELVAPLRGRVPTDVLFGLSVALLFGPAAAAGRLAWRRWQRSIGWRPFGDVASLLERLPADPAGTALVRMAIERRFEPLPDGRTQDEWIRLELALPGGGLCAVTGSDHLNPSARVRTTTNRGSRLRLDRWLRTTLACELSFDGAREVDDSALQAPYSLHRSQADGRWRYRLEKDNHLNDSAYRLVSPNDLEDLLGKALAMTSAGACRCDAIARAKDLFADHVKSGALRLVSETSADFETTAVLECTTCGAQLTFTRNDSFHQPTVEWRKRR